MYCPFPASLTTSLTNTTNQGADVALNSATCAGRRGVHGAVAVIFGTKKISYNERSRWSRGRRLVTYHPPSVTAVLLRSRMNYVITTNVNITDARSSP
jgi:hypothetical protein